MVNPPVPQGPSYEQFENSIKLIEQRWQTMASDHPNDHTFRGWTATEWAHNMLTEGVTRAVWDTATRDNRIKVNRLVSRTQAHEPDIWSGLFVHHFPRVNSVHAHDCLRL